MILSLGIFYPMSDGGFRMSDAVLFTAISHPPSAVAFQRARDRD
jgi:hypothetical protein